MPSATRVSSRPDALETRSSRDGRQREFTELTDSHLETDAISKVLAKIVTAPGLDDSQLSTLNGPEPRPPLFPISYLL